MSKTPKDYEEYMSPGFKPKSDEELCKSVKTLFQNIVADADAEHSILSSYWQIGNIVLRYYKGKKPKKKEITKIVEEVHIEVRTLNNAIEFGKKYTIKDVETLKNGKFTMSWHLLVQHLKLEAADLLRMYKAASNRDEFCNAVTEFKSDKAGEKDPFRSKTKEGIN